MTYKLKLIDDQMQNPLFNKVILAIILALVILPFEAPAQANNYLEKIIPPSPTAAALGEYGDNQVSLFSGTPSITIPIYELTAKNISLPISLSYNASGIKVEQTASNVGLGWSLNAGGVITRTVRGLADGLDSSGNLSPSRSYLPLQVPPNYKDSYDAVRNAAAEQGVIDTEPDIFYYNFNGRSGSFYLDAGGNVVMNKYEDLRIKFIRTAPNNYKFEVTTEDGSLYVFQDIESTAGKITAWFLTSITNANQTDQINFNYESEDYIYLNQPRFSRFFVNNASNYPGVVELLAGDLPDALADRVCRKNSIHGKRLKSIVSLNMGSVEFVKGTTARLDVIQAGPNGAYPLKEILIKDLFGKTIKNFVLETSFIRTTNEYSQITGYECPNGEEFMNYRMYLDKITESSEKVYAFEYSGRTADNKDLLPHRMSAAQDWSGFYNGKNQNQNLVPKFSGYLAGSDNQYDQCAGSSGGRKLPSGYVTIPGANRDVSYPEVTYGTLKSISYPTGGSTDFSFELHNQSVIGEKGGIRIKSIINRDITGAEIGKKEYTYQLPLAGYGNDFLAYTYYAKNKPQSQRISEIPFCDAGFTDPTDDYEEAVKINAGSFNDLGAFNGNHMGYGSVTESQSGNGRIIYTFSGFPYSDGNGYVIKQIACCFENYPELVDLKTHTTNGGNWPAIPNNDSSWKRGILTSKTVFDDNGDRVGKEEYLYNHIATGSIPGIKILTTKRDFVYIYSEYTFPTGWNKLSGKKTYSYDMETGEELVTTETYEYNGTDHKQVTKSNIERSNGDIVETSFIYPPDISLLPETGSTVINTMKNRHMISPLLRKEVKIGSKTLTGQITNFQLNSGRITRKSIEVKEKEDSYEKRVEFVEYDAQGNLLEQKMTNGPAISFVWGYNKQYPIAEISNASYGTMTNAQSIAISEAEAASDVDDDNCKETTCKEQQLREKLRVLREAFPNAQVVTYTYDPHIGITSITDPRGNTNYFKYDYLNRLIEVRDTEENIVVDHKYYYHGK